MAPAPKVDHAVIEAEFFAPSTPDEIAGRHGIQRRHVYRIWTKAARAGRLPRIHRDLLLAFAREFVCGLLIALAHVDVGLDRAMRDECERADEDLPVAGGIRIPDPDPLLARLGEFHGCDRRRDNDDAVPDDAKPVLISAAFLAAHTRRLDRAQRSLEQAPWRIVSVTPATGAAA
jgi:hypothetical protein